jgi:hypothetical protein
MKECLRCKIRKIAPQKCGAKRVVVANTQTLPLKGQVKISASWAYQLKTIMGLRRNGVKG